MKTLLLTLTLATLALNLFAQGTVIFNNRVAGSVITHVYGPEPNAPWISITGNGPDDYPAGTTKYSGAALEGPGYLAQLLVDNSQGWPPSTAPVTFRTGAAAGFVNPTTATLVGVPADAFLATIRMVVWDNSSGNYPTWNATTVAAWNAGTLVAGMSPKFTLYAIGGMYNPAPNLIGLQSFNIYYVPEPSTIGFAGLGAAALALMRRLRAGRTPPD